MYLRVSSPTQSLLETKVKKWIKLSLALTLCNFFHSYLHCEKGSWKNNKVKLFLDKNRERRGYSTYERMKDCEGKEGEHWQLREVWVERHI